jgi:hypothetical protein
LLDLVPWKAMIRVTTTMMTKAKAGMRRARRVHLLARALPLLWKVRL